MKLAELFVELGVDGDKKTVKSMDAVKGAFDSVVSTATLLVGAVTGAFYGLSKLTSKSAKLGTDYQKFSDATGVSIKQLQKWETAGRKASVSADSIRSSIAGVQDTMAKMKLGQGAPAGLDWLKDFDSTRMDDTFYVLEKIQQMTKDIADPAIARQMAASFGVSQEMITAMRTNSFTPQNMTGGESLASREIKKLKELNGEWNRVFHSMEISSARFVSRFGDKVIYILDKISEGIGIASDKLMELSKDKELVDNLTRSFEAFKTVMSDIFDIIVAIVKSDFFKQSMDFLSKASDATVKSVKAEETYTGNPNGIVKGGLIDSALRGIFDRILPSPNNTNKIETKNNNTFNISSNDPKETAREVDKVLKSQVNFAYRSKAGALNE